MYDIHRIDVPTARAVEGELSNASLWPATMPMTMMTMTRTLTSDGTIDSRVAGEQSESHGF